MNINLEPFEVNFLQPEYFAEFKCDGQKCGARCCQGWKISIDEDTLIKYQQFESEEKEFTSQIKFFFEYGQHYFKLDEKGRCPFLNDENLCKLQLNYGEDFIPDTCKQFPRVLCKIEDVPVFERALTVSCPVAAEIILLSALPIKFKMEKAVDIDISTFHEVKYEPPEEINTYAQQIRMTAIKILQERDLTIDQRLAVLGVFLDIIDETIKAKKFYEIPQVLEMYESKGIIYESLQAVWQNANFDYKKFVKIMLSDILEVLYGKDSKSSSLGEKIFSVFKAFLNIDSENMDEKKIDEVAKKLAELEPLHEKFTDHFAIIFENWLVNEFFINCYPWSIKKSIPNNFGVFVATYKIVNLMAFVDSLVNNALKQKSLLDIMIYFSRYLDHLIAYRAKISDVIGEESKIPQLVSSLLKTRNY